MENWTLPTLDPQVCTGCGLCVEHCTEEVVALVGQRVAFVHPEACTYCGACEAVCPTQAINLTYVIVWEDDRPQAEAHGGGYPHRRSAALLL
ncbi:MAG: 4Fe-4S binding protein [Anaerolineae bacterium]|nr:4Fe-4S binding protein [Anaerolineae bacterium]